MRYLRRQNVSYSRLDVHREMLTDEIRTGAYERAIAAIVQPGDSVADFGCGTGILSFFAARAGAAKIYAIDRSPIIRAAQRIAAANSFSAISFLEGKDVSLPESVNVLVSEWMGHFAFKETMFSPLIQLRDRSLRSGGIMIPRRIVFRAALVRDERLHDRLCYFRRRPWGVDFSPVAEWAFAQTTLHRLSEQQVLPGDIHLGELDMATCSSQLPILEGSHVPQSESKVFGIAGWFEADLSASESFSTGPRAPATHWYQVFFPIPHPVIIKPGMNVSVRIQPFEVAGVDSVYWRWRLAVDETTIEMDDVTYEVWLRSRAPQIVADGTTEAKTDT